MLTSHKFEYAPSSFKNRFKEISERFLAGDLDVSKYSGDFWTARLRAFLG